MAEGGGDTPEDEVSENVSIPCEFCGNLFPITKIILHQSGCYVENKKSSEPKRSETHVKEPQVTTGKVSEHRNKHAEINQNVTIAIKQHASHHTFELNRTGSRLVMKKNDKVENEKIREASKKHDEGGGKSEKVPQQNQNDRTHQNRKKDDEDNFVRKESFSTKEEPRQAQKPNSKVHNEKSFAYSIDDDDNDDLSDLSDDYNPENETVEHFMGKALMKAKSLKRAMQKPKDIKI